MAKRKGIVPTVTVAPPYTDREHMLAGLISTQAPFDQMHPVMALPLARFLLTDPTAQGILLGRLTDQHICRGLDR